MNFRKNQRWISIAIGLVVVGVLVLALGGYFSSLGNAVLQPVLQAQQWLTVRFQAFQDFFNAPTDLVRLRQENAELQAEVANLQTEVISLQQQVTEVELLSALLDFARSQRENEYKSASVVFRDPRPFALTDYPSPELSRFVKSRKLFYHLLSLRSHPGPPEFLTVNHRECGDQPCSLFSSSPLP